MISNVAADPRLGPGEEMLGALAQKTHVYRLGPLIFMQVTIQDDINPVVIHHLLHGLPHAFSLLVMDGVCGTPSS